MMTPSITDLLHLTPVQRLRLAQELCASVATEVERPSSTDGSEARQREVDDRAQANRLLRSTALSFEAVLARLEQNLRDPSLPLPGDRS